MSVLRYQRSTRGSTLSRSVFIEMTLTILGGFRHCVFQLATSVGVDSDELSPNLLNQFMNMSVSFAAIAA